MSNSQVPSVLNPYRDTAMDYRKAGFGGPLPLPYREKHPPPLNFTKRESPYPTKEEILNWCEGKSADGAAMLSGGVNGRHNICIRLAGVDEEHELLGIDVDDYIKGDKKKEGNSQLLRLCNQLGPLPDTWISSARVDGKSGIRYFRVPRGLAFRGKVDKDIEVIRKGHRFAVVWPSIHPDGGIYWWFPPGVEPDKSGKDYWNGQLPDAKSFPILPDKWIDFLTNGRTQQTDDGLIDVDSGVQDLYDWATDTFHGDDDSPTCSKMREKLELHKRNVEDEATSHDKLTNGHWNLLRLAAEGHLGWNNAVNELEHHFAEVTIGRGKRGIDEVNGEIFRSRIQALRKIKGQIDERQKIGAVGIDPLCTKIGLCGSSGSGKSSKSESRTSSSDSTSKDDHGRDSQTEGGDDRDSGGDDDRGSSDSDYSSDDDDSELGDLFRGAVKSIDSYEMNDDGNAKHLVDTFSSLEFGAAMRYAEGLGWIVWHQGRIGDKDTHPHWEVDPFGDQIMRRMWHQVKKRQVAYAEACYGDYLQKVEDEVRGVNNVTKTDVLIAKNRAQKWMKFSEMSGNNRPAENAIKAARSIYSVSIDINELDKSPYLLGVKNGVVELDKEEVRLRPARLNDYVTLNTGVAWTEPTKHAQSLWQEYLDTFIPDVELQKVIQVVMGHCLIGGNREKRLVVLKGITNTGKSTLIGAIEAALGDYAQSVNQSVFQNHKLNPILARSIPKRVILCSEFDEKDSLSASQVKRLTGSDVIQAELKGSNVPIEGAPQFVPILATNEVPTISGADKALQNRLYVIPFNTVPNRIRKESAGVVETICREAVLAWLIEGYAEYRRLGELPTHQLIEESTEDFFGELDPITTFARECIEKQTVPEGYVSRRLMYDSFKIWWSENNYPKTLMPSKHKFTRNLKAIGFETSDKTLRVGDQRGLFWYGIKLTVQNYNITDISETLKKKKQND